MSEPKPLLPGTYYGELSPEGEWRWNGTGQPDDAWIEVAPQQPEQQATTPGTVPLTQAILHTWDNGSIIRYCVAGLVQAWELYTLAKHDIISKHGLS